MRTGREYLQALRDQRTIFLAGQPVDSVAEHPAFAGAARTVASLYDLAADPASEMSYQTDTGTRANQVFLIPHTREDLQARRLASTRWALMTHGFFGRGPDHVAGFLAGFASAAEVFGRFGDNVVRYYRMVRDQDLYVTYVIIPPHVDRTQIARGQPEAYIQVGVVAERDNGIVVRGSQKLGTGTAIADELFVTCMVPQKPGDEDYALSFAVPVSTPGLKLHPRRPYAASQPDAY